LTTPGRATYDVLCHKEKMMKKLAFVVRE